MKLQLKLGVHILNSEKFLEIYFDHFIGNN